MEKNTHGETNESFEDAFAISEKFSDLSHVILRDLNEHRYVYPFKLYTKEDINKFLTRPELYQRQLREACIYMYGASTHFRRLIQYFASLTDFAYVVEPYKIDPRKANVKMTNNNYRKVLNLLSSMNLKSQLTKVVTTCFREDVFYATLRESPDNIIIQQLPSDFCAISFIEDNVPNVTFDFQYFNAKEYMLDYYPEEFRIKYEQYKSNTKVHWIELDSPTSFAVKYNTDTLEYALPPFAGLLREVYELEDYKAMRSTSTALDNYAMVSMTLPMDSDGNWAIDLKKAKTFYHNLDNVLPPEIGSILTPMELEKISFERSDSTDADTVSEAEEELFTAAGVSSLLFNNEEASANALLLSIKADQALTYNVVKSIGDAINRYVHAQSYGKNFKVNFLDVSVYNRSEMGDAYLKAASYGIPTISYYCASQGMGQAELDSMSFLETKVLGLQEMFVPIQNANTTSSDDLESKAATDEGGAPQKDMQDLTEAGEETREEA